MIGDRGRDVPAAEPPLPATPLPAAPVPAAATPATAGALLSDVRSELSDGEWHRMHPLTPLLRGGLVLVVLVGIVIANMRDRLVAIFLPWLVPALPSGEDWSSGDPVDWVIDHGLVLTASLVVLGVLVLLVGWFHLSWRFHTFRITDDDVEVREGVLFRSQRRAPLDRVQGVNLTRPLVARIAGLAKLQVVGAGVDANVRLEYLTTPQAERVRADILRLASGRRLAEAAAAGASDGDRPGRRAAAVSAAMSEALAGLIAGAEEPEDEPGSVVRIPAGRLVASQALGGGTLFLMAMTAAAVAGSIAGSPWVLLGIVPAILGFGAYGVSQVVRSLRYSIAPTQNGLRVTFGLFTTVTETIPPGRIHAVDVRQPIFWRPFGWWSVKINRITGRSASEASTDAFTTVLPVGLRIDVEHVLRLILPEMPEAERALIFENGILGPREGDPYTVTPRRARILRPLSWRRNGFLFAADALLLRRGAIRRSLAIFPFARLQSIGVHQGPVDRALRVASLRPHTVAGPVDGYLAAADRDRAVRLFEDVAARACIASGADRSHRWAAGAAPVGSGPASAIEEAGA